MSWFSKKKTDEEFRAEVERESRRMTSEVKAKTLAWAERVAREEPDSRLAQAILDSARNDL